MKKKKLTLIVIKQTNFSAVCGWQCVWSNREIQRKHGIHLLPSGVYSLVGKAKNHIELIQWLWLKKIVTSGHQRKKKTFLYTKKEEHNMGFKCRTFPLYVRILYLCSFWMPSLPKNKEKDPVCFPRHCFCISQNYHLKKIICSPEVFKNIS